MKFSADFSELAKALDFCNIILNDKTVEEKMRNVIFMVRPEGVTAVGYNALTFAKQTLEKASVDEVDPAGYDFQVKSSDLNKIVSSFSSLFKTKVETIDFELDGVRIKVTVHEVAIKEEDERLNQSPEFFLECPPILANIKKEISMEFPEDFDGVGSSDLLLYLDSLFPLLVNDNANGSGSKISFAEDYVFVISSVASGFFVNKLPEAFKEITLGYSSVNFLKKMCMVGSDQIAVSKTEKHICVQSEGIEAFLRFQNVKPMHKMYIKRVSKDRGIVVDRLYLRDVLKRMGNMSSDGKVSISEDMEVVNDNFNQIIPVINKKGEVSNINFKVSIPIVEKCILGSDGAFPDKLFIYFVEAGRGYSMIMSDETGAWFSLAQVSRL